MNLDRWLPGDRAAAGPPPSWRLSLAGTPTNPRAATSCSVATTLARRAASGAPRGCKRPRFLPLTFGAEDEVDARQPGHGERELLRVFDEVGQARPALGLALDQPLDQRRGLSFQAHQERLVGAEDLAQPICIVIGLEGLGDEQEPVSGLAVERARGLDVLAPELVAKRRVRPGERLELDRRVRYVVVSQRVDGAVRTEVFPTPGGPVMRTVNTRPG